MLGFVGLACTFSADLWNKWIPSCLRTAQREKGVGSGGREGKRGSDRERGVERQKELALSGMGMEESQKA